MNKTLQQRNTQHLFGRLLIVLLAGSLLFYVLMRMQAKHMQRKQLELSQLNIWTAFVQRQGMITTHIAGEYDIVENGSVQKNWLNEARDTSFYYADQKKWLPFERLTQEFIWEDKRYQLTTYVSSKEISHLVIKVFITEACIFVLLFVAIIYINRKTSGTLWMPFRSTLKKLNAYDITKKQSFELPTQTGITEFNELNAAVDHLIAKVNQAYHNQKQFVENASHEIQTPLSIIRSKLELLINQPDITEKEAFLLADITEANDRLSQLNRSLLLLAKIENNQFPEKNFVNLSVLLDKLIITYQQYYEDELPSITKSVQENVSITANSSLMEILINNLVKNAIVHNIPSGYIHMELNSHYFKIVNTGRATQIAPEQLFERFRKGGEEIKSTGLGLALVKQICQFYDFRIDFKYAQEIYSMILIFR